MFVISKYSNGLQEMEAKLDNGSFVSLFKKDKKKEEDEDSHSKMDWTLLLQCMSFLGK